MTHFAVRLFGDSTVYGAQGFRRSTTSIDASCLLSLSRITVKACQLGSFRGSFELDLYLACVHPCRT